MVGITTKGVPLRPVHPPHRSGSIAVEAGHLDPLRGHNPVGADVDIPAQGHRRGRLQGRTGEEAEQAAGGGTVVEVEGRGLQVADEDPGAARGRRSEIDRGARG